MRLQERETRWIKAGTPALLLCPPCTPFHQFQAVSTRDYVDLGPVQLGSMGGDSKRARTLTPCQLLFKATYVINSLNPHTNLIRQVVFPLDR